MSTLAASPPLPARPASHTKQSTAALALLALGVVYGDIGTSPLYAAKETFDPQHGIPLTPENIVGGVSAIFWALTIVVSVKYVSLVLRAGNRGEGGNMALLALATASVRDRPRVQAALLAIGVFGASLFYGDAVLTPAISGVSARVQAVRRAARDRHSGGAVRDPALRHRRCRPRATRCGYACSQPLHSC
jgi:KUP system potassium uptake protein